MSDAGTPTFPPDVVEAVCRHMNGDHTEDCRIMVAGLAGIDAIGATMTGFDADNAFLRAQTIDGDVDVALPWSTRITERAQVRSEVVRMYGEASQALGIDAAGH